MNRKLAFAFALLAWLVASPLFAGEPVTAFLEKVRGSVVDSSPGVGASTPLKTGDSVPAGDTVSVGRLSVAVYKIGTQFMLKQDPRSSMKFVSMGHVKGTEDDPDWTVDLLLQNGDLYSALEPANGETADYRITTSRVEAIAHNAVFKVSHAYSTSMIFVKEGMVEVLYCNDGRGDGKDVVQREGDGKDVVAEEPGRNYSKRVMVHAGEAFIVTDCDGVLRWQTDLEMRSMLLFAALTGAGFGDGGGVQVAMLNLDPAVLAPTVPPGLPIVSP